VAGAKFCEECAAPLGSVCPTCGTTNRAGAKFCSNCATPLAAGAPAPRPLAAVPTAPSAPSEAAAERRVVSVLFADLVGFTPFAEERDAEDVRDTLTRYFEMATEIIGRYGGSVEKFIGDAVMAVWGAPTAREDDAERAVRAALDLVDRVPGLAAGVQARAGVLTGEAAVTIGATNQGMVAGDLVNTAARLQGVAEPGTVLVGETTRRATSGAIVFEPIGDTELKGKSSPVPAFRAMRVVAQVGGRGRAETLEAPFVGRDEEMRLLKDLFHATGRERRPRLVSVIGPGGIGKSRLAWEFLKYIDGLSEVVWWHDGRSPAYGDGITFWALGEMVRERAGLLETDDEKTTREKLAASLREHVPNEAERASIERALLVLLGFESGVDPQQLFGAWRTFFERLADSNPVVMVFEDLHFADQGLLDFIDHLLEWSRSSPITIVTLARPELLDKRPNWGAGKRSFTSIYLEPLAESDMRLLLAGLVPGLPAKAMNAIVARADGIPLYAVETVRMLLAEGRLTLEDGVYRPRGDLDDIAVPESLTALIAARLDGLSPADRSLIADASVLGQSFTLEALAALAGVDSSTLQPQLAGLVRRELLSREADPRSPELGQYVFVQALIREVAYNTLSKKDRKQRHLAAARFFEAMATGEVAGALAGHYLNAYRAAGEGPEAEALKAQARLALRGAAERAAALGSHGQAVTFLEQALEITTDPAEQAELHGRALASASEGFVPGVVIRHAEGQVAARRQLGDRQLTAIAAAEHARAVSSFRGDPVRALEMYEAAWQEFSDLERSRAGVMLMMGISAGHGTLGRSSVQIDWLNRLLPIAEQLDVMDELIGAVGGLGAAHLETGRPREGMVLLRGSHSLAIKHGIRRRERFGRQGLMFWEQWNEPEIGLQLGKEGIAIARQIGSDNYLFAMLGNAVVSAIRVGEWDWAVQTLNEWTPADTDVAQFSELFGDKAVLMALRGEDPGALLDRVTSMIAALTDPQYPAYDAWFRAWAAFSAGRFAEAADLASRAPKSINFFHPLATPLAARAALWAGDLSRAREELAALDHTMMRGEALADDKKSLMASMAAMEGRTAEAIGLYREGLAGWRGLGLAWDEALTVIDMAKFVGPSEPEVQAAAEWALATLRRLGAKPYIERLEEAMRAPAPTGQPSESVRNEAKASVS
jgi:class 3 adenylate cyclase